MSSRRDLAAQQQRLAAEQVQYAKQCQFWTRSLDRNDADSAAVVLLNRRLQELKTSIQPSILLDLGQGLIRLAKDGSDTLVNEKEEVIGMDDTTSKNSNSTIMNQEQYELSVEFLLRSKLRRKLLNRIFRRLNRLAAAMDGNLEIPAPPKYGDLRLSCDETLVREFYENQLQKDAVQLALAVKKDLDNVMGSDAMNTTVSNSSSQEDTEMVDSEAVVEPEKDAPSEEPSIKKDVPQEDDQAATTKETTSSKAKPVSSAEAPKSGTEDVLQVTSSTSSPPQETTPMADPFDFRSTLLKDYKDAYEKALDKKGNSSYTLFADEDPDEPPEYLGAGIGATARHMSAKEREVEYHRWQTTLLARIPEQPTFAELGLEHRVFHLEERRKELEAKRNEGQRRGSNEPKATKNNTSEGDDMDVDKEEAEKQDTKKEPKEEKDDDDNDDDDDTEDEVDEEEDAQKKDDNEEEEKEDEEKDTTPPQVVRPISLVAVPSFYEQDLRRIKNVHADLIHVSLQDHAMQRLQESTNEYNTAFKASIELLKRRNHISEQIRAILYEGRRQAPQPPDMMQVNAERARWHLRRQQFEHQKLNSMLPSRANRPVQGTSLTQRYRALPDRTGITDVVGECLGDVVDAVEAVAMGMIRNVFFNERFVPSAGESAESETAVRLRQMEAARRHELNEVTLRINQLEEVRKKAWRKAMKTKAEFDLPHQHVTPTGAVQVIHVNMNNYGSIQVPVLTQGGLLSVPKDLFASSSIASYKPKPPTAVKSVKASKPKAKASPPAKK